MDHHGESKDAVASFGKLLELIATLRSENGCPWDRKQTPESFHPYILEEYHELVQAIKGGEPKEIVDEMGDLLFLVVFVAYMFEQQGITNLSRIMQAAIEKMTRRHPHVFGDARADDAQAVIDNWTKIKASEENIRTRESILDGVPKSLPALLRAQKLGKRAAKVGFDWTRKEDVFKKVEEEFTEFKDAAANGSESDIKEELGDLLFVVVNAARHVGVNSEIALNDCSDKFERRFHHIERSLSADGKGLLETDLEEMDRLWDEAKDAEKAAPKES